MTTIQIQKVSPPTPKQRESNIFGSCNLLVLSEDNMPICYLNNITIRLNTKTNMKFLAPPSFKYDAKDGTTKHMNYYSILPLPQNDESKHEAQRESLRALTAEVVQHAENGGLNNAPRKPQQNTPAPAATSTTTNSSDPWA